MAKSSYDERRTRVETYFNQTAVEAWRRLTSDAPVSGVRATVRAGRERMRQTLLDWLPADLSGKRLLDAGCGPGMLSVELVRRGADVVAIDVSANLIELARERFPSDLDPARIDYRVGDMLDPQLGDFDYVVSMDVLIHYPCADVVEALVALAQRTADGILFTFAPRTPLLAAMHAVGGVFPRRDRAPAIEPVAERKLRAALTAEVQLQGWRVGRTQRVAQGFYTSQALELKKL